MLNRVLRITIVVVFAVTGLILTEYLLPYISDYFDYKFYGNGFFGIAFTTIVSGSVGIFVFGSMGMALALCWPTFWAGLFRICLLSGRISRLFSA